MPRTIADYIVIQDASFTLTNSTPNQSKTLPFKVPSGTKTGYSSVLLFWVGADNVENLRFRIYINRSKHPSAMVDRTVSGDSLPLFGTWHEVISDELLVVGDNDIEFDMSSDEGTITFSDVVLMIQRSDEK